MSFEHHWVWWQRELAAVAHEEARQASVERRKPPTDPQQLKGLDANKSMFIQFQRTQRRQRRR